MDYRQFKLLSRLYKMNKPYVIPASKCHVNCFFCSDKFSPSGLKSEILTEPIPVGMFKKLIKFINPGRGRLILGEGYLNGGEFTSHPRWKEFISILNNKFKDLPIILRSSEVPVDEDVKFLAGRIEQLTISFVSINREKRKKVKKVREGVNLKECFQKLENFRIKTEICMLVLPEVVGWEQIKKDIYKLDNFENIQKISFISPGYTKNTPLSIKNKLKIDEEEFVAKVKQMDEEVSTDLEINDLWLKFLTEDEFDQNFKRIKREVTSRTVKEDKVLLLTSVKLFPVIKEVRNHLNLRFDANIGAIKIENSFFGGNVNTGGLLTISDYLEKKERINSLESDVIITTRAPLDIEGYDLRGDHKSKLENALDSPILFV